MTARLTAITVFTNGGRLGFRSKDMALLLEDVQKLEPTLFLVVPALANQLYKQFQELVAKHSQTKTAEEAEQQAYKDMKHALGKRVMIVTCGTAPTSAEVKKFLSKCFQIRVSEGYGSTEW